MASSLGGGSSKGGGGSGLGALAIGPQQAGQLLSNMYSDAGLGGLGWNAAGTQRVGTPTPDLQYDIAGAEAGPANLANLTNQQIALTQGSTATQTGGSAGFNAGFSGNSANSLGNPTG